MIHKLKPYPAYRDSSVPWLGEVPEQWDVRRLKHSFRRIVGGSTPSSTDEHLWDGDIVWITPADVSRRSSLHDSMRHISAAGLAACSTELVPPGSIIVTSRAPVGNVAIAEVVLCTNQGCKSLVIEPYVIDPQYAFHALHCLSEELQSLATGTTFTEISSSRLGSVRMPLPPHSEQSAIVRYLDYMDRRIQRYIRAKQKLIKLLEEQKQAFIHQAVTGRIDVRTGKPYPKYKPSGVEWLGDVPEHWEVRTLGQLASSFRTGPFGSILHQSDYVEGGTPLINPTHLRRGCIIEDQRCCIPPSVTERLSNYILEKNDLVFSRRGELGRCALVRDREAGWFCGTGSIRVRIVYEGIEPEYLIEALQVRWIGEYLSLFSVGATMDNLNTGILKGVAISFPPKAEQVEILTVITHHVRSTQEAVASADREISLFREYRTRLISDIVTGKLDVREAAANLPEELEEKLPEDQEQEDEDNDRQYEAEDDPFTGEAE